MLRRTVTAMAEEQGVVEEVEGVGVVVGRSRLCESALAFDTMKCSGSLETSSLRRCSEAIRGRKPGPTPGSSRASRLRNDSGGHLDAPSWLLRQSCRTAALPTHETHQRSRHHDSGID